MQSKKTIKNLLYQYSFIDLTKYLNMAVNIKLSDDCSNSYLANPICNKIPNSDIYVSAFYNAHKLVSYTFVAYYYAPQKSLKKYL